MLKARLLSMTTDRVHPYVDPPQRRVELVLRTFEYRMPFNYPNIAVERRYGGGETHGVEMFPVAEVCPPNASSGKPAEGIVIREELPIVRVAVIGSACTPPGYVTLEAVPCDDFRRADEMPEVMPVRFRAGNLWGMHLRYDQWAECKAGGRPLPDSAPEAVRKRVMGFRCTAREMPLAGMSCAVFEIPPSKQVRISGGCEVPGWTDDTFPDDAHYSFRIIRTTVVAHTA
jgi:hypothetical protein